MKKYLKLLYLKVLYTRDNILPRYFILNPFLSKFYYFMFSTKFNREHHAVLKGKVYHLDQLNTNKLSIYTLIRNTHRIEKGLLMRPRRKIFALDYIKETIDVFINVWTPEKAKIDLQYKWFHDVLNEYFITIDNNKLTNELKQKFNNKTINNRKLGTAKNQKSIPYLRLESQKSKINYEDFYKLTLYRRSVRWFLNKKVPGDLVDKAILAALQAPSACNRQPFQYRIIDEPNLLKQVANLPGGVKGYVDSIPMLIVVIGNLDAYFDERDRHLIYIDASLANMTFMLALETLGLSSCAINWPDVEQLEVKMEKLLKLQKFQRPIMCMAVGFPDPNGSVAFSEKRNLEKFRKYNYENTN